VDTLIERGFKIPLALSFPKKVLFHSPAVIEDRRRYFEDLLVDVLRRFKPMPAPLDEFLAISAHNSLRPSAIGVLDPKLIKEAPAIKSGWLLKIDSLSQQPYPRYFVLQKGILCYYTSEDTQDMIGSLSFIDDDFFVSDYGKLKPNQIYILGKKSKRQHILYFLRYFSILDNLLNL